MSEYMFPREKPAPEVSELDNTGTLFEGLFDEEHPQPEVQGEVQLTPGVFVTLDDRLDALEKIAAIYAQRNQGRGFAKALNIPPYARTIEKRYRDGERVAVGMAKKAIGNDFELSRQIARLTKADELKRAGFGYDNVDNISADTAREIRDSFGEDSRYAGRQKALRGARKLSEKRHPKIDAA